jgi:hypothetical protein
MSHNQVMTTNSLGGSQFQNFRDNKESRFPSRTGAIGCLILNKNFLSLTMHDCLPLSIYCFDLYHKLSCLQGLSTL